MTKIHTNVEYISQSRFFLFVCGITAKPRGTDVAVQGRGNGYICSGHGQQLLEGSQERGAAAHWWPAGPLFQEQPVQSEGEGTTRNTLQNAMFDQAFFKASDILDYTSS